MAATSNNPARPKSNRKIQLQDDPANCQAAKWSAICAAAIKGHGAATDEWAAHGLTSYSSKAATLDDLIVLAVERAAFLPAQSQVGALFLAHVLLETIEGIHSIVSFQDDNDIRSLARRAERLASSIRTYLANGDTEAIERACGGYFFPTNAGSMAAVRPYLEDVCL